MRDVTPNAVASALFVHQGASGLFAGAFLRSDPRLEMPDIQINMTAWSTAERNRDGIHPHPFPGITLSPVHLRPEGRGTVRAKSLDPLAPPEIRFNFLKSDYDMQALIFGIRTCRRIAAQPALAPFITDEIAPGARYSTDAELADIVRAACRTTIRSVPAAWARDPTRWWTRGCVCMVSQDCGWRTRRSCRPSLPETPMHRRS